MTAPWLPDELDHAGPEHLDADFVAGFDRKQGWPDTEPDIAALRDAGVLGPHATVVDLGTGTGRFARAVAPFCGRVIAVDISAAMLAHLRTELAGLSNVDLVHGGFLSYPHEGPPADAVYTRHALHQLPDFFKGVALARIAATLRPGGILRLRDLIYDFDPADAPAVFANWFTNASKDPATGYTADDYATHIRTEHSTYRWLFEPLLTHTGFDILDTSYEGNLFGTYTCLRR
jgi:SAM-dependent methyltransferase